MEPEIVKIELTVRKAWWLEKTALLNKILTLLDWPLATGGCKIIDSNVLIVPKEP